MGNSSSQVKCLFPSGRTLTSPWTAVCRPPSYCSAEAAHTSAVSERDVGEEGGTGRASLSGPRSYTVRSEDSRVLQAVLAGYIGVPARTTVTAGQPGGSLTISQPNEEVVLPDL